MREIINEFIDSTLKTLAEIKQANDDAYDKKKDIEDFLSDIRHDMELIPMDAKDRARAIKKLIGLIKLRRKAIDTMNYCKIFLDASTNSMAIVEKQFISAVKRIKNMELTYLDRHYTNKSDAVTRDILLDEIEML